MFCFWLHSQQKSEKQKNKTSALFTSLFSGPRLPEISVLSRPLASFSDDRWWCGAAYFSKQEPRGAKVGIWTNVTKHRWSYPKPNLHGFLAKLSKVMLTVCVRTGHKPLGRWLEPLNRSLGALATDLWQHQRVRCASVYDVKDAYQNVSSVTSVCVKLW